MTVIEQVIEGFTLSMNNIERQQWQRVNHERVVEGVNQDEQSWDYHHEEVRQGFNHEVIPQNLEPVRRVQLRVREELGNDSEEEDATLMVFPKW